MHAVARVVVSRELPVGGLEVLADAGHDLAWVGRNGAAPERDTLLEAVAEAEGLVTLLTDRVDAELLAAAPKLRAVGNVAVGYDNIDVPAATARGVGVCNTPGVLDETVADLTMALILATCRLFGEAEADLRAGRWPGWDIGQYLGQDVHGATLGLVGFGRIARAVGRRAAGFGMAVIHHTRSDSGEAGWTADLDQLVAAADVVSLHVPLRPDTRHLIDARRLALMKPTAVLVNTARGPVVDEDAVAAALEDGRLFAAGFDVFDGEPAINPRLLRAPRTVLLPHIGSASVATRTNMVRLAASGVEAVLAGVLPPNLLNPEALGGS
jgi:lactate dehydrogenase-like 2-hydroxyacid dehydrogenase